jgi:hypothetical protein
MRKRLFLTLSLVTVLAVTSCAPASTPPPAAATRAEVAAPTAAPATPTVALALPTLTAAPLPTETPFPAATSRGPNLEATDPTTVSLAAGQLQLVEFFRFT